MYKLLLVVFLFFSSHVIAADLGDEPTASDNPDHEQLDEENEETEDNKEESEDDFIHEKKTATVQILNKITAKIKFLEIPVDSEVIFNSIKIKALHCWKSSPYDLSENKILLNISEKKTGQQDYALIFNGWMFSSSPAISSMEHPVYDVVAINCHD